MTRDPHFSHGSSASVHSVRALHDVGEQVEAIPLPGFRNVVPDANGAGPVRSPAQPTVSLVIPAKNEARNLATVLGHVPPRVGEVILVDGHSTDVTKIMAVSCRPDIRIVSQDEHGKGHALRAGFAAARGDIIVAMDADGSMAPSEIPNFIYFLEHGFDFVKGSRFIGGGGSLDLTKVRRVGNRALLAVANTLYRTTFTDLCYGYFAFYRKYLDHLDLMSSGFEIETELTIRAVRAGLRIAEIPSMEMPRRTGQSSLRSFPDGARVLRTLMRERSSAAAHRSQPAAASGSHDR
jgi:glycosyltransferase involved in cell wall biosynthesis